MKAYFFICSPPSYFFYFIFYYKLNFLNFPPINYRTTNYLKWFTAKLPGKSAIATKYLKEENWYTVIPVGGDIPFNTDEEKQKIAEKYEKAYKEEIPFKINSV
ncbi:hypothetical protein [Cytobacillus oceanisediminis]|uniref:hypothetical protein n=1 Tax=Cytobacillus oceanisediminis TaxID=665099 RepID=UPI001FB50F6D|nr:hypothetical protein [Cytobacillus oceanisediminis]UOE53530.1 hypothetical protein IRB79_16805 [Cytobacillus oceanisediminis]